MQPSVHPQEYGVVKIFSSKMSKYIENIFCNALRDYPVIGRSEMLVRQDFDSQSKLPPRMFLEQVMDSLTKSYCFLWEHRNDQNRVHMTWKNLSLHYNKNAFRSNLRKLYNKGLLSYEELDNGISIELVGWDEVNPEG